MSTSRDQKRTLWYDDSAQQLRIIDQTQLPHQLQVVAIETLEQACDAIVNMQVRGAPLIGITAAFGVHLALRRDAGALAQTCETLAKTRPTAINLQWALSRLSEGLVSVPQAQRAEAALEMAKTMLEEDAAACSAIGDFGLELLSALLTEKQALGGDSVLNILTHCNAGWLATGGWGTALAPIYKAHQAGLPVHVWVDETRPRNQGASLTAWELAQSGVPHTLVVDNAGGHLMQHGMVDVCLVGSDRTTASGDVCNKIGTYLKALAAYDNAVPFYVALPTSTIDFELEEGVRDIPIEERAGDEVTHVSGIDEAGVKRKVAIAPAATRVSNFGFDVTPARLVSGLITEKGVFPATGQGLQDIRARL
ncbi:S-methyl-5-thioribose-1-phosphate isomerase [Pseudohongiella acticola]|uniref:Methylthioribose-1-phosphate isomerase n=1 Tax=Pseudohongiella acticola TaxID=1524254 RepID=A0A1E8CK09_9GAMM|nr:S-methyl-5-thioribose-1-phosphate isomerase [Pseudohongiella acticola]OFE12635.1 S-methyl-5-thioribose-1-phosphate isomerase [Pseudohongiella acticola]